MSASSPLLGHVMGLLMVALRTDLGDRMTLPRVALFRAATSEWVFDTAPGAPRPDPLELVENEGWLGVIGDDVFTVDASTVPELIIGFVLALQYIVLEETGQEWPELYQDGRSAGLAQPVVGGDGQVGWSVLGSPPVPFGSLA